MTTTAKNPVRTLTSTARERATLVAALVAAAATLVLLGQGREPLVSAAVGAATFLVVVGCGRRPARSEPEVSSARR